MSTSVSSCTSCFQLSAKIGVSERDIIYSDKSIAYLAAHGCSPSTDSGSVSYDALPSMIKNHPEHSLVVQ